MNANSEPDKSLEYLSWLTSYWPRSVSLRGITILQKSFKLRRPNEAG